MAYNKPAIPKGTRYVCGVFRCYFADCQKFIKHIVFYL